MGEIAVKPIHNVHKKYRKMNLVNPYWTQKPFISTWKTDNLSTGSSTSTQVKLPLISSGTYNFSVDWGDGSKSTITVWNQAAVTHTYAVAGTYQIKITGTCVGWQFNNTGDRLKILSVQKWGQLKLGNVNSYFYGCANLDLSGVDDILNLTGITTMIDCFRSCTVLTTIGRCNEWNTSSIVNTSQMFLGASNFNQNISSWNMASVNTSVGMFNSASKFNQNLNSWDVSNLGNASGMFQGASVFNNGLASGVSGPMTWITDNMTNVSSMFSSAIAFNQNIGSWNVSKVTNFQSMFSNSTAFNNGGSPNINSWILKTTGTISMTSMFSGAIAFNQPLNSWDTSIVVAMNSMFNGANIFNQDLSTWNVSNVVTFNSMFQNAAVFNNGGSPNINNWVINTLPSSNIDMANMFFAASAFNQPIGAWNVNRVTTMFGMFQNATTFNQPLNSWDTSNVVNMVSMFQRSATGTNLFNQPLNLWNTANVTTMASMFSATAGSVSFNQDISSWNVSKVTDFSSMFRGNTAFNNGLASGVSGTLPWTINTSAPVTMASMFNNANKFNQNLNSWDVSRVTTMSAMFQVASVFNNGLASGVSGILSWNTGNVTTMANMFENVPAFNQDIGNWDTGNVTNMTAMFSRAISFNQDISSWNVSKVTTFNNMFRTVAGAGTMLFNNGANTNLNSGTGRTGLNGWDVSSVTNMQGMFEAGTNAVLFNRPINDWNTANVTTMQLMFSGTTSFNQDIGSWNVSNVTNFVNFMGAKTPATFSTTNLDAIYNGWSTRPVKTPITITFGTAKYTAAGSAGRAILTGAPNNWVITDGGI